MVVCVCAQFAFCICCSGYVGVGGRDTLSGMSINGFIGDIRRKLGKVP